jgi:ATP-binding cassette subfamily F protein 3
MAILTASNVSQSFGEFDVFSGISVSLPRDGKAGLVGPNGIGKTTLLHILAGHAQPSTGGVHLARGTRVGYLSQESADTFIGREHSVYEEMLSVFTAVRAMETRLREMEAAMADSPDSGHPANGDAATDELFAAYSHLQIEFELAGGYDYETRIRQVLTGLGFRPPSWSQSLTQLSGGQKTRVLLGRLLLEMPDLLILDEPTNHLDVEAIEWLENTLNAWPGAVLVVSHDRYFLDKVANTIWEMSRAGMEIYRGNYSAYVLQRQERWERRQQEYETLMERLAKEMDFIRRNISGQRTQMAWGKLNRLAREVEAIHAGGLAVVGQLQSQGWARVAGELDLKRPAANVAELHARINEIQPPLRPLTLNVRLRAAHRSGNIVLRTQGAEIGFPGNSLFTTGPIELLRLECAALIGPNGTGKTTFLRTVLGELPPFSGEVELGASLKVGYFAQTQEALLPENTVLNELLRHKEMTISEARDYLARFLFRGDDVFSQVQTLSGGERSRLALAILVLENANFLLLDEPTNHLDIPAQEELQAALEQYDGTVLLVSHDRYLVNRLATQIWDLQRDEKGKNRLIVFTGPYQEYIAARAAIEQRGRGAALVGEYSATTQEKGRLESGDWETERLSKNEQRRRTEELTALEAAVAEAEASLAGLVEAMQTAGESQSYEEVQRISQEYSAAEARLEQLLQQWEALAKVEG